MQVHDDLEARPQEHVRGIRIGVQAGDLAPLQLKSKGLVQSDAQQHAETVGVPVNEVLGELPPQIERGLENVRKFPRHVLEGVRREEVRQEGVFSRRIIRQSQIEVKEGHFEIVVRGGLLGKISGHCSMVRMP